MVSALARSLSLLPTFHSRVPTFVRMPALGPRKYGLLRATVGLIADYLMKPELPSSVDLGMTFMHCLAREVVAKSVQHETI